VKRFDPIPWLYCLAHGCAWPARRARIGRTCSRASVPWQTSRSPRHGGYRRLGMDSLY